ncbi:MAG: FadR family transcriptional regulator [Burkholderiaceae bacterium]|nr:FadR family transcriptional regulator [Burkholderiaceae bacterium]
MNQTNKAAAAIAGADKAPAEMTLADQVTDALTRQIRDGVYPVSARLPTEKFMTQQYGVSRTVVREAISRLKSEGLVETRQGSGTVVLDPKRSESFRLGWDDPDPVQAVLHIIELRRGIEVEMVALAAERRTEADLAQIEHALQAIDGAVRAGKDGVLEDLAFHMAISRATGNPHYTALLGMLTRAVKDAIKLTRDYDASNRDLKAQVRSEHRAIFMAIKNQDVTAARAAAFLHMRNTAGRMQMADKTYWEGASQTAAQRLVATDLHAVLNDK